MLVPVYLFLRAVGLKPQNAGRGNILIMPVEICKTAIGIMHGGHPQTCHPETHDEEAGQHPRYRCDDTCYKQETGEAVDQSHNDGFLKVAKRSYLCS